MKQCESNLAGSNKKYYLVCKTNMWYKGIWLGFMKDASCTVLLFFGIAYSRFIDAIHMLQIWPFHMSMKHKDVLKAFASVQCSPFRNNFPETDLQIKIIK